MSEIQVIINGKTIKFINSVSIKDVIGQFFNVNCEFLVTLNSAPVNNILFESTYLKYDDVLQIVAYSNSCYRAIKRKLYIENEGD